MPEHECGPVTHAGLETLQSVGGISLVARAVGFPPELVP